MGARPPSAEAGAVDDAAARAATADGSAGRRAVLLLHFGGPQSEGEVEPFLRELFADRDCIQLPLGVLWQGWFARRVARRRAPQTAAQYAAIGGGSPLVPTTFAQAEALSAALRAAGLEAPVVVGMRYTAPFVRDAVARLRALGAADVVALTMYPHYSVATAGSAFNAMVRAFDAVGWAPDRLVVVPAWHTQPGYVRALVARIGEGLEALGVAREDVHLLFSAHGLPARYVRRGDPYLTQIQQTVEAACRALAWPADRMSLAFQSRVGPVRWLEPETADAIDRLAAEGVRALLVVPVSFVGEHIETLYEIDVLYRQRAAEAGIDAFGRAPALDVHPQLVEALRDVVVEAFRSPVARCVRCLLPERAGSDPRRRCRDCGFRRPRFVRWLAARGATGCAAASGGCGGRAAVCAGQTPPAQEG